MDGQRPQGGPTEGTRMGRVELSIKEVKNGLKMLGYFDGKITADPMDTNFRTDLRRFQGDMRIGRDGLYGGESEGKLLPLMQKLNCPPSDRFYEMRRWTLTCYYYANEADFSRRSLVPVVDPKGKHLATVPAAFFASMALEGTGKLKDGRILNVASNPSQRKCDPKVFAPVFSLAKRNGWIPSKPGYAGIRTDGTVATHARTFYEKKPGPGGWTKERKGIELEPFRTLATDTGRLRRHDKRFKGKGGVVPPGTRVYILEYDGMELPDGTVHDGWFVTNDTGGGIFGAHFDVFVGYRKWCNGKFIPHRAHVWFEGIEDKLEMDYSYGL
jgi:3D (Asp-Asp-Asp) domain-containing protein